MLTLMRTQTRLCASSSVRGYLLKRHRPEHRSGGFDVDAAGFKPLRGGRRDVGGELALRVFSSTKPVIAADNGTAAGIGVTMILPMDIRITADSVLFALP
jgi:enoyl-CoA hydratase/carnithine racemase